MYFKGLMMTPLTQLEVLGGSSSPRTTASPHSGKYPVSMVGEGDAPSNDDEETEENAREENQVEIVEHLVKQQINRINQNATLLQLFLDRIVSPNEHPPETPPSLSRISQPASGKNNEAIIDQLSAQV